MKRAVRFLVFSVFLVIFAAPGLAWGADLPYDEEYAEEFSAFIASLKAAGDIPDTEGRMQYIESYSHSLSDLNRYDWNVLGRAANFVLSTDILWFAASTNLNRTTSGCGIVFRENGSSDFLLAALRMTGKADLWGLKGGSELSFTGQNYSFDSSKTSWLYRFALVVHDNAADIYLNGEKLASYSNLSLEGEGNLGFAVLSGTAADFGVHCDFDNAFIYTW